MTTQLIITIIGLGFAAGVLSGLVGVGGGIIMVPTLVFFLGFTQHQAQGTSLIVLTIPVTIFAAFIYYKQCQAQGTPIDMRIVWLLATGFAVGGVLGGKLAVAINQEILKKIFAIVLIYAAMKMLSWDVAFFRWVRSLF